MIEAIKKEINELSEEVLNETFEVDINNKTYTKIELIPKNTLFEILNKYQDKYKNAWEELKELIDGGNGYEITRELEQKYGIDINDN